jgi:site-specific recombinase XerD
VGKTAGSDWVAGLVRALDEEGLAPRTIRVYQYDLEEFLRWYDPRELGEFTKTDLQEFHLHLSQQKGLKPAIVNRQLQALRRLCRWAYQRGVLKTDATAWLKIKHLRRSFLLQCLTEDEINSLLRAAGRSPHGLRKRNYALLQPMLQTGLQVSEVAGLRVLDVVLRPRTGWVEIRPLEGPERRVPLPAGARRGLNAYLKSRDPLRSSDLLFLSETRLPLSIRSIHSVIWNLARRAKITRLRVSARTLRHTFAWSFLKENPGQLAELAALLGHTSLATTVAFGLRVEQVEHEKRRDDERHSS